MARVSRLLVIMAVASSAAWATGGASEWPFSALPSDALVYVEIPNPQELAASVDRFAAGVLGMPMPNLLKSYLSGVAGGRELASLDWNRPAGLVLMKAPAGAPPSPLLIVPVKGEKELLADFKDPVTGESAIEKREEGGYALPSPTVPGDKLYLALVGDNLIVGDSPQSASALAAHLATHPALFTRQCAVSGDLLVHLPMARLWSSYQRDIEAGIEGMKDMMAVGMQMQPGAAAQAQMLQAALAAEVDAALGLVKQVEGMVLAADLMDLDVKVTKRVTPKTGTPFSAFIAANPGAANLPYSGAVPPGSAIASVARFNAASMAPMVAFVKDKIMTVVMPATAEETRKMNEMLDEMMKHLSGDMMVAYQVQPDKPGGFMGMQVQEVIGLVDPPAGFKFFEQYMETMGSLRTGMMPQGMMSMETTKVGSADGVSSYRMVISATGDPEMERMVKAMYGEGLDLHMAATQKGVALGTDKSLLSEVVSRANSGATAPFHALEKQGTPNKVMMMRFSMMDMLRLAQKMVEAQGETLPFSPPPAGSTPGILMLVGTDKGDLQADLIVPGAEITAMVQMAMGAAAQMQTTPQGEAPQESY